jgi:hypothetical protein
MEKKELTRVETWSYTTKYNGTYYNSKQYATRDELAAVITELIRRTPMRFTTITIVRTDAWR